MRVKFNGEIYKIKEVEATNLQRPLAMASFHAKDYLKRIDKESKHLALVILASMLLQRGIQEQNEDLIVFALDQLESACPDSAEYALIYAGIFEEDVKQGRKPKSKANEKILRLG